MIKHFKNAILLFLALALITGVIYPLVITAIVQLFFKKQANGSIIEQNGQPIGSKWIGQNFTDPKYFWGRPSDTPGFAYNASSSGSSNYSMMNDQLLLEVKERITELQNASRTNNLPIPVDLATSSASGLDPDISIASALYQAGRIAAARSIPLEQVINLINQHSRKRMLGFLGEPVVNVLQLNLALDALK